MSGFDNNGDFDLTNTGIATEQLLQLGFVDTLNRFKKPYFRFLQEHQNMQQQKNNKIIPNKRREKEGRKEHTLFCHHMCKAFRR